MSISHNMSSHPLYSKWKDMKARCNNDNHQSYRNYGERGVKVCDSWTNDPMEFIYWAIESGWDSKLEIDRIDNDGDYCPDNCRWVTHAENSYNRRSKNKYRGVYYEKRRGKYLAYVKFNQNRVNIGYSNNVIDCAVIRDSYVISNNLPLKLNFPQQMEETDE